MINKALLEILICPQCKGTLEYDTKKEELICRTDRKAFPIQDDIPVMLMDETRNLDPEEV